MHPSQSSPRHLYLLVLVFLVLNLTVISATPAKDGEQPGLVLREKISTIDSHEALVADLVIPANTSLPRHQHPGDEFLYMLDGQVKLARDGHETLILNAGQGLRIPAGTVHSPVAGAEGARAIVFRVHPEGEAVTNLMKD